MEGSTTDLDSAVVVSIVGIIPWMNKRRHANEGIVRARFRSTYFPGPLSPRSPFRCGSASVRKRNFVNNVHQGCIPYIFFHCVSNILHSVPFIIASLRVCYDELIIPSMRAKYHGDRHYVVSSQLYILNKSITNNSHPHIPLRFIR